MVCGAKFILPSSFFFKFFYCLFRLITPKMTHIRCFKLHRDKYDKLEFGNTEYPIHKGHRLFSTPPTPRALPYHSATGLHSFETDDAQFGVRPHRYSVFSRSSSSSSGGVKWTAAGNKDQNQNRAEEESVNSYF